MTITPEMCDTAEQQWHDAFMERVGKSASQPFCEIRLIKQPHGQWAMWGRQPGCLLRYEPGRSAPAAIQRLGRIGRDGYVTIYKPEDGGWYYTVPFSASGQIIGPYDTEALALAARSRSTHRVDLDWSLTGRGRVLPSASHELLPTMQYMVDALKLSGADSQFHELHLAYTEGLAAIEKASA